MAILEASDGWCVLYPCWDEENVIDFEESPVLAWACESWYDSVIDAFKTVVDPVAVESMDGDFLLRDPNGRLLIPEVQAFKTLDEAKKYFKDARASKTRARLV